MSRTRHRAVLATAAVSILVTACGGNGNGDGSGGGLGADFEEIEELARQEGELVLYTATHDGINEAEITAFNEAYPEIEVIHTRLVSGELTTRFASEAEAGAQGADLIKIADNLMLEDRPDWFQPLDTDRAPNLTNVDSQFVADHYVHMMAGPFVVTANTEMISTPPTRWEQLIEPPYAGAGELADPRASGAFMAAYAQLREWQGDEFLTAIADAGYPFYDSSATAVQQAAAGEFSFVGPGQHAHSLELREAGAPLETSTLEPTLALTHIAAVAADAQNPNAAMVYLNWLLSEEGQAAACSGEYQALATDQLDDCPAAPADLTVIDARKGNEQADQIVALLGLE
ncbi:MAG: extracellular solute-binding protein [Micromonosporaceae bacterium]|nr:extracellular solute-binding protein [Micromonosporaceae bacterium]